MKSVKKRTLSLVQSFVAGVVLGVVLGSTRITPSLSVVEFVEVPLTKEILTYY